MFSQLKGCRNPKIDFRSKQLKSCVSRVRWKHPFESHSIGQLSDQPLNEQLCKLAKKTEKTEKAKKWEIVIDHKLHGHGSRSRAYKSIQ